MFLLVSAWGFASLVAGQQTRWTYVAAYGGAALAVLSKGLPAAVFLAYAAGFLALAPAVRRRQRWRRHVLGWCGGGVLAASWFALMYWLHGDALWSEFFRDQMGEERMAGSPAQALTHFLEVLLLIGASFLPWIVPLFAARQNVSAIAKQLAPKAEFQFLLGWIVLWIGLASSVERVNLRYLLPIAPLLSVVAAAAWRQADPIRLARAARPGGRLANVGLAATTLGSVAAALHAGHAGTALALILAAVIMFALAATLSQRADALRLAGLGVTTCFVMLAVAAVGLAHVRLPDVGWSVAQELRRTAAFVNHPPTAVLVGEPGVAARARVHLRGAMELQQVSTLDSEKVRNADLVLIVGDGATVGDDWLPLRTWTHGFRSIDADDLAKAALGGRLEAYLADRRQRIVLAVRGDLADDLPLRIASHRR
jgi:4-amino-4-deoxy-L-arabinose transferase-like glycosyltransferase